MRVRARHSVRGTAVASRRGQRQRTDGRATAPDRLSVTRRRLPGGVRVVAAWRLPGLASADGPDRHGCDALRAGVSASVAATPLAGPTVIVTRTIARRVGLGVLLAGAALGVVLLVLSFVPSAML